MTGVGRLGGECNSSPVASDEHVFVSDILGKTYEIKAGTKFELLATIELAERISASPKGRSFGGGTCRT